MTDLPNELPEPKTTGGGTPAWQRLLTDVSELRRAWWPTYLEQLDAASAERIWLGPS